MLREEFVPGAELFDRVVQATIDAISGDGGPDEGQRPCRLMREEFVPGASVRPIVGATTGPSRTAEAGVRAGRRRRGCAGGSSLAQGSQVGVDHHADQLLEADLRLPAELLPGLRRIADEQVDLGRTEELLVDHYMVLPVRAPPGRRRSGTAPAPDGSRRWRPRSRRAVLLQHQPHGPYVVGGEAPVPLGVQVAERHRLLQPQLDGGRAEASPCESRTRGRGAGSRD